MPGLAIKRLTLSDLTIFDYHFRQNPNVRQKGINLDARPFISDCYPLLAGQPISTRYPVDTFIYGPSDSPEYRLLKTIIKAEKNWRLDGALIYDPPDQTGRFNELRPGDFSVLNFIGEMTPEVVQCLLIAARNSTDRELFRVVSQLPGFGPRVGMIPITERQLIECAQRAGLSETHSLYTITLDHDLREAIEGSAEAVIRISKRMQNQTITRTQLSKLRENADKSGQLGESLVYIYLQDKETNGDIVAFTWVSDTNAIAPFDFAIEVAEGVTERIDVKTTSGSFEQPIYVSLAELITMAGDIPYRIYRVYEASRTLAKLRISEPVNDQAQELLAILKTLPADVSAEGLRIRPSFFIFLKPPVTLEDTE